MADLMELEWLNLHVTAGLGIVLYACGLFLYRLYFSPIAAFPGPLLARATFWYEFYHNWVKDGQYYLRIEEMHKKYGIFQLFQPTNQPTLFLVFIAVSNPETGPIVRVTPSELHIMDPLYFNQVFVTHSVRKSNLYHRSIRGLGFDGKEEHRTAYIPQKIDTNSTGYRFSGLVHRS